MDTKTEVTPEFRALCKTLKNVIGVTRDRAAWRNRASYFVGVRRSDLDCEEYACLLEPDDALAALTALAATGKFTEVTVYLAVFNEVAARVYRDTVSFYPLVKGEAGELTDFKTALEAVHLHGHGSVLNSSGEAVYLALPDGEQYFHGWQVRGGQGALTLKRLTECLTMGVDLVRRY